MISNKNLNKFIIALLSLSLVITISLYFIPVKSLSTTVKYTNSFDKNSVMDINLDISEENWTYLIENAIDEEYIPANITINGTTYNNVGIRAKGNSTLSTMSNSDSNRYSFKIKFDEYVDGQTFNGLSKLVLNNSMSDASYMKEYLSYDLLTSLGISTPLFAYSNISLNNENFGLYLAIEPIEEEFITRNYGSLKGNLYKPEGMNMGGNKMGDFDPSNMNFDQLRNEIGDFPKRDENSNFENFQDMPFDMPKGNIMGGFGGSSGGANLVYSDDNLESYSTLLDSAQFETTTESDKKLVVEMLKALNEGSNLENYLNVEEILKYFAVNTFIVNLDSYVSSMNHNYYLYERDGIFEILPWDYNLAFGGFGVTDSSSTINFPIDSPVTDTEGNSPLIEKLLEIDEYKEIYHNYLYQIIQYVNNGDFKNTIEKVDSLISPYVVNDPTAFYSYEEYKEAVDNLLIFGEDRTKSISAQLDGSQPSTSYGNIETTLNLSALGSMGGGIPGDMNNNMMKPNMNSNTNQETSSEENLTSNDSDINSNNTEMSNPPNMNFDGSNMPNPPNMNGGNSNMTFPPNMNGDNSNMAFPPNMNGDNSNMAFPPNMNGDNSNMTFPPNMSGDNSNMAFPPNMNGNNINLNSPSNNNEAIKNNLILIGISLGTILIGLVLIRFIKVRR